MVWTVDIVALVCIPERFIENAKTKIQLLHVQLVL